MVVNKYKVNVGVTAVLLIFTVVTKITLVFTTACNDSLVDQFPRFTRWIRARYEEDDVREANIICGTDDYCTEARPQSENLGNHQEQDGQAVTGQSPVVENTPTPSHTFWTWKIPNRIKFTYSTIPNRPYRRQPNPFAPPPLPRSASLDIISSSPILSDSVTQRAIMSVPSFDVLDAPVDHDRDSVLEDSNSSDRVVRLPPHPTWDDESHLDQPYENPYYTLPFDNALWLPRNPCGLLDLDDTVNMFVSLTSEAVAGRLGVWVDQIQTIASGLSGLTAELESSMGSVDAWSMSGTELIRPLDGTEDIALSPGIASRVQHIHREADVETMPLVRKESILSRRRRPSTAPSRRKPSVSINGGALPSIGLQRPPLQRPTPRTTSSGSQPSPEGSLPAIEIQSTTADEESFPVLGLRPRTSENKSSPAYRSFSYGSRRTNSSGPASSYFPNENDERHRTISNEFGMTPTNDQRYLGSALSIVQSPSTIGARSNLRSGGAISTFEAVVHEVIDEEMRHEGARQTQEEEEVAKTKKPRSWLTSWMFSTPWKHHD